MQYNVDIFYYNYCYSIYKECLKCMNSLIIINRKVKCEQLLYNVAHISVCIQLFKNSSTFQQYISKESICLEKKSTLILLFNHLDLKEVKKY